MRYFTKEWYKLCQEYGCTFRDKKRKAALKSQLDAISMAYRRACEQENLPKRLRENFTFHDGKILDVQTGTDYVMAINSPFSEYHKVTFRNAVVKQDAVPAGAVWLYEELYRHALGYEAHILCSRKTDLYDAKIICTEIMIEV